MLVAIAAASFARRRAEADAAVDRTARHLIVTWRDVAGFFFRGNAAFRHAQR